MHCVDETRAPAAGIVRSTGAARPFNGRDDQAAGTGNEKRIENCRADRFLWRSYRSPRSLCSFVYSSVSGVCLYEHTTYCWNALPRREPEFQKLAEIESENNWAEHEALLTVGCRATTVQLGLIYRVWNQSVVALNSLATHYFALSVFSDSPAINWSLIWSYSVKTSDEDFRLILSFALEPAGVPGLYRIIQHRTYTIGY